MKLMTPKGFLASMFFLFCLLFNPIQAMAGHANLLYWSSVNMGLGHVALEVFADSEQSTPDHYISFAMGNSADNDLRVYGDQFERIQLPPFTDEQYQSFLQWFHSTPYADPSAPTYTGNYHFLRNNCAHAALASMKALGYEIKRRVDRFAISPKSVQREAKRILTRERREERETQEGQVVEGKVEGQGEGNLDQGALDQSGKFPVVQDQVQDQSQDQAQAPLKEVAAKE